jgi:predicted  nucleic acid-binding Zn-ribbon protein
MNTLDPNTPKPVVPVPQEKSLIPESAKLALLLILVLAVAYLFYDNSRIKKSQQARLDRIADQIQLIENAQKVGESSITSQLSTLKSELVGTQEAVGNTKAEIKKTATQIQAEGQRTKQELSKAIATKADTSHVEAQVQAAKSEADSKINQVNTEVGGVKSEVSVVRTDLENTRRDLEGTQRQLVDVRDTLSAAVAKNSSELSQLRLKGERDYVEFTIPKKNQLTKVEDIRLILTKTDQKKGKFNLKIVVDDNQLEKKDRFINEPIQFLVGQNRVRYEVVVNWVQKDQAGGYLSIPKDKALSSERTKR